LLGYFYFKASRVWTLLVSDIPIKSRPLKGKYSPHALITISEPSYSNTH
jgi:hypothetical protein